MNYAALNGRRLLKLLFGVFCIAYPIAVIGVAFDVRPSFSLAWAGSVLLFLEGILLIIAATIVYGLWRGLSAGLLVIVLSYIAESVGVGTGFPFGSYRYTDVLIPTLPGSVPAAVMFAWVLIIVGAFGSVSSISSQHISVRNALLGATLATLLDLEIEPVAFHLEHYWDWSAPGTINYYGVPLANFIAWFIIALLLLLCVGAIFRHAHTLKFGPSRLALWMPRILFAASLFMFGLVDLTHGYYGAIISGMLAGLVLWLVWQNEHIKPENILSKHPDR